MVGMRTVRVLLPISLQPTCSLMDRSRSLTLVLMVTMLLEKMAGNEWSVMCHHIVRF